VFLSAVKPEIVLALMPGGGWWFPWLVLRGHRTRLQIFPLTSS